MYNLLVKGTEWADEADEIHAERVFEHTAPHLAERFKPNGVLDLQQLSAIPSLFVTETGGTGTQFARIGTIRHASDQGRFLALRYQLDSRFPPISNRDLGELAKGLEIGAYELRRTHWAVKNVDLFAELLRAQMAPLLAPKVFTIDPEVDSNLMAVMMPFRSEFDDVFAVLKAVAKAVGMTCQRADDLWRHDIAIQDVVSLISRSRIVVCDCTGGNPNVFYEAGIAHAIGRDVILLAQNADDVPFNLRHLRFASYKNTSPGRTLLSTQLEDRIRTLSQTQ